MVNEDMEKSDQTNEGKSTVTPKRFKMRWQAFIIAILFATMFGSALIIASNNCSLWSDKKFSNRLDKAIKEATNWVHDNEVEIMQVRNIALIKMLQDCNTLYPAGNLGTICDKFMAAPANPACWKGLMDSNYPIQSWELNQTIKKEYIDNKWILYALAPHKANVTPEQIELFLPDKWNYRQLTHQLWALIHLRKRYPMIIKQDKLIEHLCNRITRQNAFNMTVADLYFQRAAFVMYAGFPEKIRRRWIERVIKNQRADGGWNDRWFCFESIKHRKRPVLSIKQPPSVQHPTIQALWLLCQVKYRYPEYFGLN